MPNVSDMFAAYLRKEDVESVGDSGLNVEILRVRKDSILSDGEEVEKWFMDFAELPKALVLNKTNAEECAEILKSQNTDDWAGKVVNLFIDSSVQYRGKKIGGLRIRAAK